MSGRERSGPAAARADLFAGMPWVICPTADTSPEAVAAVTGLIGACGGQLARMPAAEARPLRRAGIARPAPAGRRRWPRAAPTPLAGTLALAGQGLRDVVRIAASDAGLWTEILTANAEPAREILLAVAEQLAGAADMLAELAAAPRIRPSG